MLMEVNVEEFINDKLNELKMGKSVILLKPLAGIKRRAIYKEVSKIQDMVSFSIGKGSIRRMVLRYSPNTNEFIDINSLIECGNIAYQCGNYDECIKCYKKLVIYKKPTSLVYSKLGLAYLKKGDIKEALDYLIIANELIKEEKNNIHDFTALINKLQNEQNNNKIITVNEENDIISDLLLAKNYYSNGDYTLGDSILKKVEQTKNKSKTVKLLFEEIRRNKRFYKNRSNRSLTKTI